MVEVLTDDAEEQFAVGRRLLAGTTQGDVAPADTPPPHELTIRRATPFKNSWILRFAEIADRNEAEQWRDRYLLVASPAGAPSDTGEVFYHDLIGMRVERIDGRELGHVTALYEVPQGLLVEVATAHGTTMLPYRSPLVVRADLARRALVVDPPAGLLEDG